jgi:hypothetical protein
LGFVIKSASLAFRRLPSLRGKDDTKLSRGGDTAGTSAAGREKGPPRHHGEPNFLYGHRHS